MKKYCPLVICLLASSILLSACTTVPESPIKYQRKLEKYLQPASDEQRAQGGTIDLSEGPKLNYNSKFGPRELSFDIKIIDPY